MVLPLLLGLLGSGGIPTLPRGYSIADSFRSPRHPAEIADGGGNDGHLDRVLFDDAVVSQYSAQCLDGTPAGYYLRRADPTSNAGTKWVFFLKGGGLCVEPVDCHERTKGADGSSKYYPPTFVDDNNVLSAGDFNPFAAWNAVYLPYCSGDTHMGLQRAPGDLSLGLQFSGHLILEALLDHLHNTTDFANATDVLLSGGSAGGIGTFHNADWMMERVHELAPQATFKAAPQAGFYFPSTDLVLYPEFYVRDATPFAPFAADYVTEWFDHPFIDASCAAAHSDNPAACWNMAVLYDFIAAPLFVAENRYDQNQIGSVLGVDWWPLKNATRAEEFKEYFGSLMLEAMEKVAASPKQDGIFMPSCYDHTDNLCMLNGPLVRNVTFAQALWNWYSEGSACPLQLLDDCNNETGGSGPCNTHCQCN